jgi:hypothetical protein
MEKENVAESGRQTDRQTDTNESSGIDADSVKNGKWPESEPDLGHTTINTTDTRSTYTTANRISSPRAYMPTQLESTMQQQYDSQRSHIA